MTLTPRPPICATQLSTVNSRLSTGAGISDWNDRSSRYRGRGALRQPGGTLQVVQRPRNQGTAPEGRGVAAAVPLDRRLAPMAPERMGGGGWDKLVAASGQDQQALLVDATGIGQGRMYAVHRAQIFMREGRRLAASELVAAAEQAPGQIAHAHRRH